MVWRLTAQQDLSALYLSTLKLSAMQTSEFNGEGGKQAGEGLCLGLAWTLRKIILDGLQPCKVQSPEPVSVFGWLSECNRYEGQHSSAKECHSLSW